MNVKVQNQWFDKLTIGFIFQHFQKVILSLSKDEIWICFDI